MFDSTSIAGQAKGYVQVAADAAVGLGPIPAGTRYARIIPEAQAIRWRDDGVNPTIALGQPLAVGQELIYTAAQLSALRVIGVVAGALVNVTFYA